MKRIVATLAVLAALAFPAGVLADTTGGGGIPPGGSTGGMTIQIRAVHLTTKAVAQVDLAISCLPKPASEPPLITQWEDAFVQVSVRQASGKSIAFGDVDGFFDPGATCDGTPHVLTFGVAADPSSVPFKSGTAAVGASAATSYSYENWDTGGMGWVSAGASTGWLSVRLGK